MSNGVIGSLRVNLGLDSAKFEKGVRGVNKSTRRMQRQFKAISKTAAAIGASLSAVTVLASKNANEITRLTQVSNANAVVFQKWSAASATVGIEQEKLADILKDTTDRVGDFITTGGGPMADFFENIAPKVGVTADQFAKLSGPEALQLFVKSLEDAGASQQEMTFYMEALASDATLLLPLLKNNAEEMSRLGKEASDLGGVLDNNAIASLNRLHLANKDLGVALSGVANRIAIEVAPSMEALSRSFTASLSEGGSLRLVIDTLTANLGRITTYVATAVTFFGVRYVKALVAAKIATLTLSTSLIALRGALIRTGVGALVVGLGELIYRFIELREEVGSVANVFTALKEYIFQNFDFITLKTEQYVYYFKYAWNSLASDIKYVQSILAQKLGFQDRSTEFITHANALDDASRQYYKLSESAEKSADSIYKTWDEITSKFKSLKKGVSDVSNDNSTTGNVKTLTNELLSLEDALNKSKSIFESTRTPVEIYNTKLKELKFLLDDGKISQDTFTRGLKDIQDELLDSNKAFELFGDVVDGIFDKSLNSLSDFVKYGKQMIMGFFADITKQAMRSQFLPNISGSTGGNILGSVGNMMGKSGGTTGNLMSFAGMGSKISAIGSGAGFFGGMGGAVSGGLSGMFTGAGISGAATAAGGGAMATIGAAVPAVLAVAAAVSFFKSKTKELDNGLRLTASGADLTVESFKKMQKSKFWGMSKKQYMTFSSADAEIADPFIEAFQGIYKQVEDGAKSLGVNSDVFKNFRETIKVSLKGLSDEEQTKAISDALSGFGNGLADLIPSIDEFKLRGEAGTETLKRLSSALLTVNDVFRTLGHTALETSLTGGNVAYELSQIMGGLEAFTSKTGAYYDAFYSDAEKLNNATSRISDEMAKLGLEMPKSTSAFRDLVDGSIAIGDLDIAAGLIELAPAFKSMQDAVDATKKAVDDLAKAEAEAAKQKAEQFEQDVLKGREDFSLDASKFATSVEAKMAATLADTNNLSNELITAQNILIAQDKKTLEVLNEILFETRQNTETNKQSYTSNTITQVG